MPDGALHVSSPESGLGALDFGNKTPSPGSAPSWTRLGLGFLSHSFWEALQVPPCQILGLLAWGWPPVAYSRTGFIPPFPCAWSSVAS